MPDSTPNPADSAPEGKCDEQGDPNHLFDFSPTEEQKRLEREQSKIGREMSQRRWETVGAAVGIPFLLALVGLPGGVGGAVIADIVLTSEVAIGVEDLWTMPLYMGFCGAFIGSIFGAFFGSPPIWSNTKPEWIYLLFGAAYAAFGSFFCTLFLVVLALLTGTPYSHSASRTIGAAFGYPIFLIVAGVLAWIYVCYDRKRHTSSDSSSPGKKSERKIEG